MSEFYDDAWTRDTAADVVVSAGQTTSGIDAALALPAHITGKVTNTDGQPVAGCQVWGYLQDSQGAWINVAVGTTASDGTYELRDLRAGHSPPRVLGRPSMTMWSSGTATRRRETTPTT